MDTLLLPEVSMEVGTELVLPVDNTLDKNDGLNCNSTKDTNADVILVPDEEEPVKTKENQLQVNKPISTNSTTELNENEAFDEAKLSINQIPDQYTEEEKEVYQHFYGRGQQAVEFTRLHCTACNVHLGSAVNNIKKRYIHPLLRVLQCKACFDFYGSGDFEKDEDGSELYCRWCGQGGKVLCCSSCPVVFCQKCIRQNLGKKALESIIESDDWDCFVCKPSQITKLRVTCRALYDFTITQSRLAKQLGQPERLDADYSVCCLNRLKIAASKRKRSSDEEHEAYDPLLDNDEDDDTYKKKKKIKPSILKIVPKVGNENKPPTVNNAVAEKPGAIWSAQAEDEVVCTPDLSLLMEDEEDTTCANSFPNLNPPPLLYRSILPAVAKPGDVQFVGQTRMKTIKPITLPAKAIAITPFPNHRGYILPSKPVELNQKKTEMHVKPNLITLQNPPIRIHKSGNTQPVISVSNVGNKCLIDSTHTTLAPGLRHEWFDKATKVAAVIHQNLNSKLASLSAAHSAVRKLEDLAALHNGLQEILSNSINSLMEIRRNLKSDFMTGLETLKFQKVNSSKPKPNDDVILLDPNPSTSSVSNPNRSIFKNSLNTPTLKLVKSAVITIPDEGKESPQKTNSTALTKKALEIRDGPSDKLDENPDTISIISEDPPEEARKVEKEDTISIRSETPDKPRTEEQEQVKPQEESDLADLPEEIRKQVKQALVESKFDCIVTENSKIIANQVPRELFRRMLKVRVVLGENFSAVTPKIKKFKSYRSMNFKITEERRESEKHSSEEQTRDIQNIQNDETQNKEEVFPEDEEEDIEKILTGSIVMTPKSKAAVDERQHKYCSDSENDNENGFKETTEKESSNPDAHNTDSGVCVDGT